MANTIWPSSLVIRDVPCALTVILQTLVIAETVTYRMQNACIYICVNRMWLYYVIELTVVLLPLVIAENLTHAREEGGATKRQKAPTDQ